MVQLQENLGETIHKLNLGEARQGAAGHASGVGVAGGLALSLCVLWLITTSGGFVK